MNGKLSDIIELISNTVIFLFDEKGQTPIGTAFMVGYPNPKKPERMVPLIVTAKHVVGDLKRIIGRFTPKTGSAPIIFPYDLHTLRKEGDLWEHPDKGVDLVVFRSPVLKEVKYDCIPTEFIASREDYSQEAIRTTDRVIFPCLLVRFMGRERNYPVVRDGTIALIPEEPVPLTYEVGNEEINTVQHIILLDATSIQGASGAPIFLWPGPPFWSSPGQ